MLNQPLILLFMLTDFISKIQSDMKLTPSPTIESTSVEFSRFNLLIQTSLPAFARYQKCINVSALIPGKTMDFNRCLNYCHLIHERYAALRNTNGSRIEKQCYCGLDVRMQVSQVCFCVIILININKVIENLGYTDKNCTKCDWNYEQVCGVNNTDSASLYSLLPGIIFEARC